MKTTALIIAASLLGATAAMAAESASSNDPAKEGMPPAAGSTTPSSGTDAAEAGKTMDSDPKFSQDGAEERSQHVRFRQRDGRGRQDLDQRSGHDTLVASLSSPRKSRRPPAASFMGSRPFT